MKTRLRTIFATALAAALLTALCARASYPVVRNFNNSNYGGAAQTWDIAQDSTGRMYFANRYGLVFHDSRSWHTCALKNESEVRSLCMDTARGRLYAGGTDEFGYFAHDSRTHKIKYHSLTGLLPRDKRNTKEIWNILMQGDVVWFQGDYGLYRYDGRSVRAFDSPRKLTASAIMGDDIFVGSDDGVLSVLRAGHITPVPAPELKGHRIAELLPYPGRKALMAVTEQEGIFLRTDHGLSRMTTPLDGFMHDNQVFCAAINGNDLAIGTVNQGLAVLNLADGELTFANRDTGMQNNTVLSLRFDPAGNLWAGVDSGIDYVEYNSPVRHLLGDTNSCGAGYFSYRMGDLLYLGTNQGLFTTPYPVPSTPKPVTPMRLTNGQVWRIDNAGGELMACTDGGLYTLRGNSAIRIEGMPGTWSVTVLKNNPEYALASTYNDFMLLHREGGVWKPAGKVAGYSGVGGQPVQDELGNIWLAHWLRGVYRLRIDLAKKRFDLVKLYNSKNGFPSDKGNGATLYNGGVVFCTGAGYYVYDPSTDSMRPHPTLNTLFGDGPAGRLLTSPGKDLWNIGAGVGVTLARPTPSGNYRVDSTTYCPLSDKFNPGFEHFDFQAPDRVIAASKEGFLDINPQRAQRTRRNFPLLVSRVVTLGDSLLYAAGDSAELKVPYGLNSLRFECVMPEYRGDNKITYSFYLEDYDKQWSAPSTSNTKEYTRLSEGTYTLHVRAHNGYDNSGSVSEMTFTVLPPWYRSTWAKVLYALIILALAYCARRWARRWSRKKADQAVHRQEEEMDRLKRHAEAEKMQQDMEISNLKGQQLELQVRHKSEELSNVMLNLARKNEVLLDISESLDKLQGKIKEGADSRSVDQHVRKIKSKINENISHDDDWRKFTHNFDAVYEGFTQRLEELHPTLTRTELKVCCYLRMGLNSKDIAPLFSISHRSVEMTRYRLRKKLGLSREDNLVSYLEKI